MTTTSYLPLCNTNTLLCIFAGGGTVASHCDLQKGGGNQTSGEGRQRRRPMEADNTDSYAERMVWKETHVCPARDVPGGIFWLSCFEGWDNNFLSPLL